MEFTDIFTIKIKKKKKRINPTQRLLRKKKHKNITFIIYLFGLFIIIFPRKNRRIPSLLLDFENTFSADISDIKFDS